MIHEHPSPINKPEATERLRFIQEQLALGIDFEKCVGIHGTSLHTLIVGINTGFIPGSTPFEDDYYDAAKRDIYFYPIQRHAEKFPYDIEIDGYDDMEVLSQCQGYTKNLGRLHEFLVSLGLPIERSNHITAYSALRLLNEEIPNDLLEYLNNLNALLDQYTPHFGTLEQQLLKDFIAKSMQTATQMYEESLQHFMSLGFSKEHILQEAKRVQKYDGIVLGLHPKVLEEHEILPGDFQTGDLRIRSNNGLDINYVIGAFVPGLVEQEIIRKWGTG